MRSMKLFTALLDYYPHYYCCKADQLTLDLELGATLDRGLVEPVGRALAGELGVVRVSVQLAVGPGGQVPEERRLHALKVVGLHVGRVLDVGHVVPVRAGKVHGLVVLDPGDVALGLALDPAADAHVGRVVQVAAVGMKFVDERGSG